MKKKMQIAILTIFVILSVVGCALVPEAETVSEDEKLVNRIFSDKGMPIVEEKNPEWLEKGTFDSAPSEHAVIHVFFDGSKSMRGYTTYPSSIYERIIISLNSVAANAYQGIEIESYKFFDQVVQMKDKEREFRLTGDNYVEYVYTPDFYGSELGVRSGDVRSADKHRADYSEVINQMIRINPMIADENREEMVDDVFIIVSDFIPQDREDMDFYRFTSRLYSEVLQKNMCCGVAAFQSEFIGDLYGTDVTNASEPINYNGRMPFYMFVIGETPNVKSFMNELDKTVTHYEIPADEYGYFITDAQSPKDTGIGNRLKLSWESEKTEQIVSEAKVCQMVSETLLMTSENVTDGAYQNQITMTFFPMDAYFDDMNMISGELQFKLPYEIEPISSVFINDDDWDIELSLVTLFGEKAIDKKELEKIEKSCDGEVRVPVDMSVEAYEYVYSGERQKVKDWEDPIAAQREAWAWNQVAYSNEHDPRILEEDDQVLVIGDAVIHDGMVSIPIQFSLSSMMLDMPYLASIQMRANPSISIKPLEPWVYEWNFDSEDIFDWVYLDTEFPGYGTPNLVNSLKALQGDNIYSDGGFSRQFNLIIAKSELLASENVLRYCNDKIQEFKANKTDEMRSDMEPSDAAQKKINIFNGGNKDE